MNDTSGWGQVFATPANTQLPQHGVADDIRSLGTRRLSSSPSELTEVGVVARLDQIQRSMTTGSHDDESDDAELNANTRGRLAKPGSHRRMGRAHEESINLRRVAIRDEEHPLNDFVDFEQSLEEIADPPRPNISDVAPAG